MPRAGEREKGKEKDDLDWKVDARENFFSLCSSKAPVAANCPTSPESNGALIVIIIGRCTDGSNLKVRGKAAVL